MFRATERKSAAIPNTHIWLDRARRSFVRWLFLAASASSVAGLLAAADVPSIQPVLKLHAPEVVDQDDACIWIHPELPEKSVIVGSDKSAGWVFVYDLEGAVLQKISVKKPGNIDCRQGIMLGGKKVDVVVVNQRTDGFKLVVFRVDAASRRLKRVDDNCQTGPNYGGCLYHSPSSGRLFFFCTSEEGTTEQHELFDDGTGRVQCRKVRELKTDKCEGAAADDEQKVVYIADELHGVWKFEAEPDAKPQGKLIARVGENGLQGDVEGLTVVRGALDKRWLLVSDQGRSRFMVFRLDEPHTFVGEFSIDGAGDTDGIDATTGPLGPKFPHGIFVCHTNRSPRPLLVADWDLIAKALAP
jgi:3-phytase